MNGLAIIKEAFREKASVLRNAYNGTTNPLTTSNLVMLIGKFA